MKKIVNILGSINVFDDRASNLEASSPVQFRKQLKRRERETTNDITLTFQQ
jgi:hypothetical protein